MAALAPLSHLPWWCDWISSTRNQSVRGVGRGRSLSSQMPISALSQTPASSGATMTTRRLSRHAPRISPWASRESARVMPHPGHGRPVTRRMRQTVGARANQRVGVAASASGAASQTMRESWLADGHVCFVIASRCLTVSSHQVTGVPLPSGGDAGQGPAFFISEGPGHDHDEVDDRPDAAAPGGEQHQDACARLAYVEAVNA